MAHQDRRTLAPGVYLEAGGTITARAQVGTWPDRLARETVFPAATKLKAIKAWQEETRHVLRKQLPLAAARGTLAHDVARYYTTGSFRERSPKFQTDRRYNLGLWTTIFGTRRRVTIRTDEINAQVQRWRAAGASASTCSHRVDAISQLFVILDGPAAPNPARHAIRFDKPDPVAR